jgi:glycine/D-amino acid oxidase-like deaminating enzyme
MKENAVADDAGDFPYRRSFWAPESVERAPSLGSQCIEADIAIVGGGYAGLSSAYYLKRAKPDLRIVLLEMEHVGFGPSGRNFGGVAPGVRELRSAMMKDVDLEEERFCTNWFLGQRNEFERRIAEGGIECEYRNEPIVMHALDEDAWEALKREGAFLESKGTPCKLLDQAHLREALPVPYDPKGGLLRPAWRAVQPFKLVRGFAKQARDVGVTIYEGTRVTDFSDDGSVVVVETEGGGTVRAGKLVMATNAYSRLLGPIKDLVGARHTNVIGTERLEPTLYESLGFKDYKFVEDSGFIFYYARVYEGRLLFGGGEPTTGFFTESTLDTRSDRKAVEYQRLHDEMVSRWPQLKGVKIDVAWGGPIDSTETFAPLIKPLPNMPNVTVCIGFNGEGLFSGSLSGQFVAGLVLGAAYQDDDAERVRQYLGRSDED